MSRQVILDYLGRDWDRIHEQMVAALGSDIGLLNDVNSEVLSHEGKQLRPMVSLLMAKALGVPNEDSIRFAVASELLHNATLIHDDVADDSAERRGNPTLYRLLGPSSAVLVGDFWLASAVKLVIKASHMERVMNYFSATLTDLAEGEMLQLEKAASADTTEEDYYRIINGKTASLFRAAAVSGAISVDAPDNLVEAADKFASSLGLAFQIKDDILDYTGTSQIGKPLGIDLREKKITLPLLGAMLGSPRELEMRRMVQRMDEEPGNFQKVCDFVMENHGVEYATERLEKHVRESEAALDLFPATPAREYLKEIARYNALRNL